MKLYPAPLFALGCLATTAGAQAQGGLGSLDRAQATFTAADSDRDARLSPAELKANQLAIEPREFAAHDADRDGSWSREEFVVFYRALLRRSGQRPAADLDQEVARVLALRRAREAEAIRRQAGQPASGPAANRLGNAPVPTAPDPVVDLDARLERALAELEQKALARGATREDFERVRSLWTARLAAIQGAGSTLPSEVDIAARFGRALDALEGKALAGAVTREEFADLRDAWAARARRAIGATPEPPEATIESRFERALAALEEKALARGATREDWQRVKDLLAARARRAVHGDDRPADGAADDELAALSQQLQSAIARLEQRAAEGKVTREEFTALRGMLVSRARAAAQSGQNGSVEAARAGGPAAGRGATVEPAPVQGQPAPVPAEGARARRTDPKEPVKPAGTSDRGAKPPEGKPAPQPDPKPPAPAEPAERPGRPPQ